MRNTRTQWPTRIIVSLLVTLALVVPIAYLASPWVYRWVRVGQLTSNDTAKRQRGLSYLVTYGPNDQRILSGAINALSVKEDANFLQIVDALQAANRWGRAHIPDDAWLRWIELHAHEPGIEAPAMAAQRLADLQDLADDPRLVSLLTELSSHPEPDVRYNALCAAAELYMSATDQLPYHHLIVGRLEDTEPVVARHAQMFAYLTSAPASDIPDGLRDRQVKQADAQYDTSAILALLLSQDAPLRDVGCVLAVRDLKQEELGSLVADLLRDTNDDAKMSGAILAGMAGLHTDLLREQIGTQADWATASVMKLGLWMRSDVSDSEVRPEALLAHGDVPRTTVILAMLHRQDAQGLEVLLNPRGEVPDDLAVLLEDYGWWRVLDQYLPKDAPNWQSGSNLDEQQLQIDLLRDWYLVNRHCLMHSVQTSD